MTGLCSAAATIAFDGMPLDGDQVTCRDHSGLQLLGLTTCPLVAPCSVGGAPVARLAAAADAQSSSNGRRHEFKMRRDLRWTDGAPVRARDFADAMVRAAGSPTMPGYWMRRVRRITVRGDRVGVELRAPDLLWPLMTALPALCPSRDGVSAGRYRLTRLGARRIELAATGGFEEDERPARLTIHRIKTPAHNVRAFETGRVDMTPDTAFPFSHCDRWQGHVEYRLSQPGVIFALCFEGSLASPTAGAERRLIARIIDAHGVREALPVPLLPATAFLPSQNFRSDFDRALRRRRIRPAAPGPSPAAGALRLGYDEWYPNRAVAATVRGSLRRAGIDVALVRDAYERRARTVDLRLNLYRSLRCDPLALFRGLVFDEPLRSSALLPSVERRLAAFDAEPVTTERVQEAALDLQALVDRDAAAIPLAEFPGVHLSRLRKPPWEWPR